MRTRSPFRRTVLSTLPAVLLASCAGGPAATEAADCPTTGDEIEQARLYVEHNATDGDTGVHGFVGGEPWTVLCVTGPDGETQVTVRATGDLGALGLSDLSWESNEPGNDELPVGELLALFPEGDYRLAVELEEGGSAVGTARFTHAIPTEPVITTPTLGDEDVEATIDPGEDLLVSWEPVTSGIDGAAVTIVSYELIVTDDEHEDPAAWSRPVLDVHLGGDQHGFLVPGAFLRPGRLYEVEVLAIEASGNQTIGLGFLRTR